jgi:hypothetical protein
MEEQRYKNDAQKKRRFHGWNPLRRFKTSLPSWRSHGARDRVIATSPERLG